MQVRTENITEAWCSTKEVVNIHQHTPSQWGVCESACQRTRLTQDTDKSSEVGNYSSIVSIVTISVCTILILSSITMVYCFYIKRNKEKEEKDTMLDGNIGMLNSYMVLNEQAAHLSYNGKYEIGRSKFEIGQKLGGGSFGSVHEGMAEDPIHPGQKNKVAIKSVNNPLDPAQIYSLICEIKVFDQLDMHLNLVNMTGACTTKFKSGKIWLLLEYFPQGDMKTFLLRNRDAICQDLHYHSIPHEILNMRLFLNWSHGICKGMEYLASKNIMHGDLAARNILITKLNNDESYLAKIGDFGLSKAFYEKDSYHKQERKNIPGNGWLLISLRLAF